MGNVHPTVPVELARRLVAAGGIAAAVETGTFFAQGAVTLQSLVPRVWSIEISEQFHQRAVEQHGRLEGVTFLHGESSQVLRGLSEEPPAGPLLFWLDAHGGTELFDDPDQTQCPLLGELDAIRRFPDVDANCILIDDARFFFGPVAGPQICRRAPDWPTLLDVIDALRVDGERYITVLDDVIVCVPPSLRSTVEEWWLEVSHLRHGDEAFEYLFHQAISPTPGLAAKRLVKSLTPAPLKARWYARAASRAAPPGSRDSETRPGGPGIRPR